MMKTSGAVLGSHPNTTPSSGLRASARRRWMLAACVPMCCVTLVSCSSDDATSATSASTAATSPPGSLPGPSASLPDGVDQSVVTILNETLKGTTVEDATERLEAAGWEVRSYDVDDPDASLTADFIADRVTIGYRQGVVLGIEIG